MDKPRILIVEDEFVVAEDLATMLEQLRYEVIGRTSEGEKAVAIAAAERPDLVLMDVRLRGPIDGIEASARIRESCDIPVVYLTAHSDIRTVERAQLTEPFGYILKPFSERELDTQIRIGLYKHRVEQTLRKVNLALEQRVEDRTRELAHSQERLRALLAELTREGERERRRIAMDLHDHLTQLLVACRINAGKAKRIAQDPKLVRALDEMDATLDESLRYTRSLMAELSPRILYELDLPPALRWVAEQMAQHGLTVEVEGDTNGLLVEEDQAILVFQCVRELLWNVVKHAETSRAAISYALDSRAQELTVTVTDQGRGFAPGSLQERDKERKQFGLVSVCERLELHGGRVDIESSPGQGTRVTLRLPIALTVSKETLKMPRESESHLDSETETQAGNRLIRVVLVDDHKMVRQGLRSVLEDYGDLTVIGEAADGLEAIEVVRTLQPDVVVMDLNLPGMSGIEAIRHIVQTSPSTVVIGLSFGTDAYILQAVKAAGAVTCITKERAVEELYRTIKDSVAGPLSSRSRILNSSKEPS